MRLYAVTVFLSAALLFQVQLILARYILPWFGGTPAVWTTCMLFFQLLLVAGYAYAHKLAACAAPRRQSGIHALLLAASLAVLLAQAWRWGRPLLAGTAWQPDGVGTPVARILAILSVAAGLPFFVLAATSPLVQAWAAATDPGRSPYPLYAVSNAGSLVGLLTYPFLVEPHLGLRSQAILWFALYVAFACCALLGARRRVACMGGAAAGSPGTPPDGQAAAPSLPRRVLWIALSAVPALLLLATTTKITEEVAVVPFFWVLPLGLYLVSFILCFGNARWYVRPLFAAAAVAAMLMVSTALTKQPDDLGVAEQTGVYCFALFVFCMIGHGELARRKPHPSRLTSFYLTVSLGGAAGGCLAAVVAPLVFTGLWELPLGYLGGGLSLLAAMWADRGSCLHGRARRMLRPAAVLVVAGIGVIPFVVLRDRVPGPAGRLLRVAAGAAGLERLDPEHYRNIVYRRNFYGMLRIAEYDRDQADSHRYTLYHAGTAHGFQLRDPAQRTRPTAYYTEASGIGLVLRHHPRRGQGAGRLRVGVVGLGVGTLAAYGRAGDLVRFYEINPAAIELATDPAVFSFLSDTPARVEIVAGDARLALALEAPQRFDVLALDAFSGDAVPVHLLTREALAVYLRHLAAGGVLAVHTSSRYLDLDPLVWRLAADAGLRGGLVVARDDDDLTWESDWFLFRRHDGFGAVPRISDRLTPCPETDALRQVALWTDDYSNLFEVLARF